MKIYIVGICGTFMAGIAMLAREQGFQVCGSDSGVYPPMSTQLEECGIQLFDGYTVENLQLDADLYVIGNVVSRGNAQVEKILEQDLPYISGPQWLYENVLRDRWVLAVAGTHGKTTTSSMLAWILQYSGLEPGFLIGGLSKNFDRSAQLGKSPFFVIEADEYDSAFFDKRSKFVHYHPRTLVLNNLEFDHADIFDDLAAIKRQFHHLLRIVPSNGLIIYNQDEANLTQVLAMGCWSEQLGFGLEKGDFRLLSDGQFIDQQNSKTKLVLQQSGVFNQLNALAATLAARHAGVPIHSSMAALAEFAGIKRRQELLGCINGINVIDDFAHHPTAIKATLQSLKSKTRGRLFALIEIRSSTMKMGIHKNTLGPSFDSADAVFILENPHSDWNLHALEKSATTLVKVCRNNKDIIQRVLAICEPADRIVIMSNGGFGNIQTSLIQALEAKYRNSTQHDQKQNTSQKDSQI